MNNRKVTVFNVKDNVSTFFKSPLLYIHFSGFLDI